MSRGWLVLDVACVVVFVAVGRSVHDHGISALGLAGTLWPFVAGLVVGWSVLTVLDWSVTAWRSGFVVAISTVTVGMCLRALAGQGTAFAFIAVALGFLGATMLAWRIVLAAVQRLRSRRSA